MSFMALLSVACKDSETSVSYENENEVAITKSIYYDANGKVYEGIINGWR